LLSVVVCVVPLDEDDVALLDEDDEVVELDELCVDPGSATARATAPATPEIPTAEVTAFTRARLRRRVRFGWSNIGCCAPSARSADRCCRSVLYRGPLFAAVMSGTLDCGEGKDEKTQGRF
jgi:hypothetical protein